jgi:hypothetical protein
MKDSFVCKNKVVCTQSLTEKKIFRYFPTTANKGDVRSFPIEEYKMFVLFISIFFPDIFPGVKRPGRGVDKPPNLAPR